MLTVGVALASLLSFTSPPEGGGDAPVIVVTPAPAPAVESQPPPPSTVPEWGPQADVAISQPSTPQTVIIPQRFDMKPRKPMMGIGLMIGSAVAFGVGIGSRVGQVDTAVSRCRTWSSRDFESRTQCFNHYDSPGIDRNDMGVGFAYGSSMVLGRIGAGALGQHQAWQSVYGDMRTRRPLSRYVFGAIFTGLGVASIATHFALVQADAKNPCTSWECNVQRRALWIAASDGGALLLNTGLGLFSWAGNYRKNLERYQGMQWGVIPSVAPGSVGATASMRF